MIMFGWQWINFDDQCWVGLVVWWQNEQIFDVVWMEVKVGLVSFDGIYVIGQCLIFGVDVGFW